MGIGNSIEMSSGPVLYVGTNSKNFEIDYVDSPTENNKNIFHFLQYFWYIIVGQCQTLLERLIIPVRQ